VSEVTSKLEQHRQPNLRYPQLVVLMCSKNFKKKQCKDFRYLSNRPHVQSMALTHKHTTGIYVFSL